MDEASEELAESQRTFVLVTFSEYRSSDADSEVTTWSKSFDTWQIAQLYIGERAEDLATRSDRSLDELFELGEGILVLPERDEIDEDEEAFFEWVVSENSIHALCDYANRLDFGLTTIDVQELAHGTI